MIEYLIGFLIAVSIVAAFFLVGVLFGLQVTS